MGYLIQSASTIANTQAVSYFGWARFPSAPSDPGKDTRTSLLQFGDLANGPTSYIDVVNTSGVASIDNNFVSNSYFGEFGNGCDVAYGGSSSLGSDWWNKWHFIAIAFQGIAGIIGGVSVAFASATRKIVVDGITVSASCSINRLSDSSGVQPTGVCVNGFDIGMPRRPDITSANNRSEPKIDLAFVQIWFGSFIDPTVDGVLNPNFYTISGGVARPAKTSIAAASFGTPDLRFEGDRNHFYTNTGDGGAFAKIGTINDLTPGPSF